MPHSSPPHFAVYAPNFGVFGDVGRNVELALMADEAGWDGWFTWDNLLWETDEPLAEPWVALAAIAATTRRIRLGPLITPLPRHRPWLIARAAVTLDHLSQGRLILGAGLGGDWYRELSAFGEQQEQRALAAITDEGLELITRLWTGERVDFIGATYRVTDVRFLPTPLQRPRIPIWIAAVWPSRRPLARAARWDGVVPIAVEGLLGTEQVQDVVTTIRAEQAALGGERRFDVAVMGRFRELDEEGRARAVAAMVDVGMTWWLESFGPTDDAGEVERVIRQGPPAVR